MVITADERDEQIVASRMAKLDEQAGPRVGDFVRFADGTLRRVSYHWHGDDGWDGGCQTSDAGSYHLGNYGVSMSGSLYSSVPTDALVLTDERMAGDVWIFHHDMAGAGRGVHFQPEFRVYTCDREAP